VLVELLVLRLGRVPRLGDIAGAAAGFVGCFSLVEICLAELFFVVFALVVVIV
jgi:hypothetical protein